MKKGKKYAFIGLIVLILVVLAVVVLSAQRTADNIYWGGPIFGDIKNNYDEVSGVSHKAGDVPHAVFADYLKVGGSGDNTNLFGIEQIKAATYVVPLISSATCNDLCRYTLGGQCKGVVRLSGGRWVGMGFDSVASNQQNKLVLSGGDAAALCRQSYLYFAGDAMCFCGSPQTGFFAVRAL